MQLEIGLLEWDLTEEFLASSGVQCEITAFPSSTHHNTLLNNVLFTLYIYI